MARRHPMDPGERDRRVEIRQLTENQRGSSGFPKKPWTSLAFVWMRKDDLRASERFTANQVAARFDSRWEMSYRADMDPELVDVPKTRQLVYQGRVYDIVAASQIGRRDGIELMTLASTKVA